MRLFQYIAVSLRWIVRDPDSPVVQLSLPVLGVLLAAGAGLLSSRNAADGLRLSGMLLQLGGYGVMVLGLHHRGRLFGKRGFIGRLRDWASRRVPWHRPANPSVGVANIQISAHGTANAVVDEPQGDPASIDYRLGRVEALVSELSKQHQKLEQALAAEARQRSTDVEAERQARTDAFDSLSGQLAKLGADGLDLEATGIVWATLGLVFGTVPGQIIHAFGALLSIV